MNRMMKSVVATTVLLVSLPALSLAEENVRADQLLDMVNQSLMESGVAEKTSKQILDNLKKHLAESELDESADEVQESNDQQKDSKQQRVQTLREAWFLNEDGKKHRVELEVRIPPVFEGRRLEEAELKESDELLLNVLIDEKKAIKKALEVERRKDMQRNVFNYVIGVQLIDEPEKSEQEKDVDTSQKRENAKALVVQSVYDDSPASAAGLEPGDKLKTIDGEKIVEFLQVQTIIQNAGKADKEITLTWERDGETMEGKLKPQEVAPKMFFFGNGEPARAYAMSTTPMGLGGSPANHDPVRKEVGELKTHLKALEKQLEEIKELLSKEGNEGENH